MGKLPIVEEFYTLQGEGFHTGKAAYFIRIGGCDIACQWCDTKMSWKSEDYPLIEIEKIVENVLKCSAKSVVVTGGEPLSYDLTFLCQCLKNANIETFLETSGCYEISGKWNWICLSPKENFPPFPKNFAKADELKVIISCEKDFSWAEENAQFISKKCKKFLQPEWSQHKKILPKIVDYIKENPSWQLSLQTHKLIGIP